MPKNKDYDLAYSVNLTPENAVKYFQSKGLSKSFNWYEVWQEQHHKAFTVAKAMSFDLLNDIRGEVQKAIDTGTTLEDFQRNLEPTLKKLGWWGKEYMFDNEGNLKLVQLGSPKRLQTIYNVNLSVAYSVGRYKELIDNVDDRPYWQYFDVDDANSRDSHMLLHKKIWRWDDPIWDRIYPPNDWECRCWVRSLTAEQVKGQKIEKQGFDLPDDFQPDEWAYNPGATNIGLDLNTWEKIRTYKDEDLRREAVNFMAHSVDTRKQVFNNFVSSVLKDEQARGRKIVAGWMDADTIDYVEKVKGELSSPLIVLTDKDLLHLSREAKEKRRAAISEEAIKNIPYYINSPIAILWDEQDPALLYVFDADSKKGKIVVRVEYTLKGDKVNLIKTAGKVEASDLRIKRYSVIKGRL